MQDDDDFVSKSQRKRDARAILDLARTLSEMSPAQFGHTPLPEAIREAAETVRAIRQPIARKRELQFLAKLLRHRDDLEEIESAVDTALRPAREETLRQHRIEAWRDRLLADGDAAVTPLRAARDDLDLQRLRQLLLQARKESGEGPPKAARALFKLLRSLDDIEPLPDWD